MDRHSLPTTFLLFSFFSLLLCTSAGVNLWALEKVRVGTGLRGVAMYEMPMMAAEEKGLWKLNGVEGEWVPFRSGSDLYRGMAAGSVEMAINESVSALQSIARGVKAIVVADIGAPDYFEVWVKGDGPIKRSNDLKGSRIGISRMGGSAYAFALVIFKGLGLEKDVRFVAVGGFEARLAALKSGAIDAFVLTPNPVANLVASGAIRSVASAKEFMPKKFAYYVVTVRKDYLEKNPKMVGKTVKVILQATDYVMKDRAWVLAKFKSAWGYDKEVAEILLPSLDYSRDGKIDPERLQNVIRFLIEYKIIKKEEAPNLDEIYTTRFTG